MLAQAPMFKKNFFYAKFYPIIIKTAPPPHNPSATAP